MMKHAAGMLASALLLAPAITGAQFVGGDQNTLTVTLSPERPRPGELVTARLESFLIDVRRASVSWFLNGESFERGVGKTEIKFRAGELGSKTTLTVLVTTIDAGSFESKLTIGPAEVTLFWQSNSYTPPFYRGKALFPFQGTASVIALPHFVGEDGARVSPKALIYTWRENGAVIGDSSGLGRAVLPVQSRIPMRPIEVAVEVSSFDNTLHAEDSIVLVPVGPKLLLYEDHPRYGIRFERALVRGFSLSGNEARFSAIPFFFEVERRSSPLLSFDWRLNFEAIGSEKSAAIVLRRASSEGGRAVLALEARRDGTIFQSGETRTTIEFPNDFSASAVGGGF